MDKAKLLGELESLIRTMPERSLWFNETDEALQWIGRATAVMEAVNPVLGAEFKIESMKATSSRTDVHYPAFAKVRTTLFHAQTKLRLETVGPLSSAIGAGGVFDYFDEVRQIIETAGSDLLFVDPYLDAEFVTRYMPHVKSGVQVRLLTYKGVAALTPAVQAFTAQHGVAIALRKGQDMHDRFVFVDKASCYQSGASFKDGAKNSMTTLTQLTDVFNPVYVKCETLWQAAQVLV